MSGLTSHTSCELVSDHTFTYVYVTKLLFVSSNDDGRHGFSFLTYGNSLGSVIHDANIK